MKNNLRRAALIILHSFDGRPVLQASLVSAMQAMLRHEQPTIADAVEAILDCEGAGYVSGVTDDWTSQRSWTLTEKGIHKSRTLR